MARHLSLILKAYFVAVFQTCQSLLIKPTKQWSFPDNLAGRNSSLNAGTQVIAYDISGKRYDGRFIVASDAEIGK